MAAGEVARDRCNEPEVAREYFNRVLAIRPYHASATWALAGLVEKSGDAETATQVLSRRLEDTSLGGEEKARVLTQLAALARAAGIDAVAEHRLQEALTASPQHFPAAVALGDLFADAQRWIDLEQFLRSVLDAGSLQGAPPTLVAESHRRLAEAYEHLGRDEDAYQTLLTADRIHRGHLRIKLALGENRYKARRWREAGLHLSALSNHDDAERHAADVAQGLYHAALAESRCLRPEKAPALYERALELRPSYGPALQALAEIAMEQGNPTRAADLLTRQAAATDEPGERTRLFEALGDMAIMLLHDEARARTCYEAAVSAAQPIEARHVPLLHKLLERQDLGQDHAGAARTSELMASFGTTATDRVARYVRAGRDYLAAGDPVRARTAADHAVEAEPDSLDAAELLAELAIATGDSETTATVLGRALSGKDESFPERRAGLWFQLGLAREQRGDPTHARTAFERAIALAPGSPGATQARRRLIEALRTAGGDDGARRAAIIEHLRAITEATAQRADLVAFSDEHRRAGHIDAAGAALDLAIALGYSPDVHQAAFLAVNPPSSLEPDEAYRSEVTADDRAALLADLGDAPLAALMTLLAENASALWPNLDEALARAGGEKARRVTATMHADALSIFPRVAGAVGAGPSMLYVSDDQRAPDVQVVCAATPVVILGPRLLAEPGLPPGELRFLLGCAAEMTRPERIVACGQPLAETSRLVAALVRGFGTLALREAIAHWALDEDVQRAHDEIVKSALSVRMRARVEQALAPLAADHLRLQDYLDASQRAAQRIGFALAGDPAAVVRHLDPAQRDDLTFALAHPRWMELRARLGVQVRSAAG
jgi:tetratricopeptide (TPR) repeat protein